MALDEKEILQPFLHNDDQNSAEDDDVELEKLDLQDKHHDDDKENISVIDGPSEQLDCEDGTPSRRPKKPALYAILFMLGAQIFSAAMNVSIRLLENASTHLHPLQILLVRMSITTLGITTWLFWQKKPNNILGKKENRLLLLTRAFGGFFGVFGLYYSLRYLNLSEATVITFMMPLVASVGGYLLLGATISWLELVLSITSLVGVLLVSTPDALFAASEKIDSPEAVDFGPRLWAICVGLLGVCGAAAAYLAVSAIGKTESPLTVVNYYTAMCTVVSFAALLVLPGLGFQAPGDLWEWFLLIFSGLSGFLMQLLITKSLQAEKSMVAVNMVYTQIVFSLALDGIVFHTIPHAVSLGGCALICTSAVVLAWYKTNAQSKIGSPEDGSGKQ
ncbi:unnamed protein product [Discula destructiva]